MAQTTILPEPSALARDEEEVPEERHGPILIITSCKYQDFDPGIILNFGATVLRGCDTCFFVM